MAEPTKLVHFFEIRLFRAGGKDRVAALDWAARLDAHLKVDPKARTLTLPSGVDIVAAGVANSDRQVSLGRILKGATGLQKGSWTTATFSPVEPESADDFFTRVTYVEFVQGCNAVAMVGGAGEVPSKTTVERLLNAMDPLEIGASWVLEPITQPGQLAQAKSRKAFKTVSLRTSVQPAGLDQLPLDDGSVESLDQTLARMASSVGGPIRVTLKVTVERPGDRPDALARLKQILMGSKEILENSKRLTVDVDDEYGTAMFNLIEHRLTASIPLPEGEVSGSTLEDAVLLALGNVCRANQNVIQGLTDPARGE